MSSRIMPIPFLEYDLVRLPVYQEPRHKCMFGTHLFCGGNACGDSGRNWKPSFRIAPSAGMLKAFDDLVQFQFPS